MLGLVALANVLDPHTTMEKLTFLIENTRAHSHRMTTIVSFGALLALICLRTIRNFSKKWWFIYRVPEVLVVVVISTSMSPIILKSPVVADCTLCLC